MCAAGQPTIRSLVLVTLCVLTGSGALVLRTIGRSREAAPLPTAAHDRQQGQVPRPQMRHDEPLDQALAARTAVVPTSFKTASAEGVVALALRLAVRGESGRAKATHLLTLLLRAQPLLIPRLVADVRSERVPSQLHPVVFAALGQAGGEQAHRALKSALSDRDLQLGNRLRAATALSCVATPDPTTLKALLQAALRPEQSRDAGILTQLQWAAVHALGRLERNARRSAPDLAAATRAAVVARLKIEQAEHSVQGMLAAIEAIHTSGHPAFADVLQPYLDAENPLLRRHAYSALQTIPLGHAGAPDPTSRGGQAGPREQALWTR